MKPTELFVCKAKLIHYSAPLADVAAKVKEEFSRIQDVIRPGMSIAIAAGSRGVRNIDVIVKTLVDCLKASGAVPFIVPAMGSHGGATAEGQAQVLKDYGITEDKMGVPVRSSMNVVQLGYTDGSVQIPVYMDRLAWESDGVIVVNRVKVHTDFHGTHESGIVKMLTIGLGKHAQAIAVHQYGAFGLRDYIPKISKKVLERGKILAALAVLEDGYDQTCDLKFAKADDIFALDAQFIQRSREMVARLPFQEIDTMIVDSMGKDISGTGMDTNVIGRIRIDGQNDGAPYCKRISVLRLTPASHGNALGVGLADVTTKALADQIDWKATNQNVITSGFLARGFLPIVGESDREAVSIAISSCGMPVTESFRLVRIRDTLHLDTVYLSRTLLNELVSLKKGEQLSDFAPLKFSEEGEIETF